jgi:hypothetical protein
MLDNPNLGFEKMIEVVALAKDVIGVSLLILVLLLLYIYRYEIGLFLKYGFSKKENDLSSLWLLKLIKIDFSELERKDLDTRIDILLNTVNNTKLNDKNDSTINADTLSSFLPSFRLTEIVTEPNEIIYHFINDGVSIHAISVVPLGNFEITFEPLNNLESNGSGFFHFTFDENTKNDFIFNLSYYNEVEEFHKIKFLYSFIENGLSIID